MQPKLVSVVIPTFNCKEMVYDCLESVKAQTYRPIEIIVADSMSEDGTRELAARYGLVISFGRTASDRSISAVPIKRNEAHTQAKGEYLYWFDSDMRMHPDTVQLCVEAIEREGADAVIVPEESYGEGFWAQCRLLERGCYNRSARSLSDAARFLRMSVWNTLGGFDTTLGGNYDCDLQLRLDENGFKTIKLSHSVLHYEGRLTLKRHLLKKFAYGTTAMRYFAKYRHRSGLLNRQFALVRPEFLAHRKVLLAQPLTAAGMLFMKFMEYAAAFCGLVYAQVQDIALHKVAGEGRFKL